MVLRQAQSTGVGLVYATRFPAGYTDLLLPMNDMLETCWLQGKKPGARPDLRFPGSGGALCPFARPGKALIVLDVPLVAA